MNRKYVGIGACFNLLKQDYCLVFDRLIVIAHSCDVKFNYNGDDTRRCVDFG